MKSLLNKLSDVANKVKADIDREIKIQKLTDQLGEKQTAAQKAVVTKELTALVQARKECSCKILTKIFK
jgi:hypothetical protein